MAPAPAGRDDPTMAPLADKLPPPEPDAERLLAVLRRRVPDRIPLFELGIADSVLEAFLGKAMPPRPEEKTLEALRAWSAPRVEGWWRLGFDYMIVRADSPFDLQALAAHTEGDRTWMEEHRGVISSREDLERFPWPERIDFTRSEAVLSLLPPGMKGILFSGGVLEWATVLMGMESFMMGLYEAPDLVRQVVDRVGRAVLLTFQGLVEDERILALWLGDDLGFRSSTLIHPKHIEALLFPWYRRYADLAHRHGKPFIFHSCGNIEPVMPGLIEQVGIDARHSFEDAVVPAEEAMARWGDRVAVLGGVDVDLLARGTPAQVKARTLDLLEKCAPRGGYAAGSGNSIPDYVPPGNYLALLQAVREFEGRSGPP